MQCQIYPLPLPPATTSVSHLLPTPHHQSELALEIELALALDKERYGTTASVSHLTCPLPTSVSHLTCPLPPHHQSELALALALEIELALVLDIEHYGTTASVSHLTCPLPPHQSVI